MCKNVLPVVRKKNLKKILYVLLEVLKSSKLCSKLIFIYMTAAILISGNWAKSIAKTPNEKVVWLEVCPWLSLYPIIPWDIKDGWFKSNKTQSFIIPWLCFHPTNFDKVPVFILCLCFCPVKLQCPTPGNGMLFSSRRSDGANPLGLPTIIICPYGEADWMFMLRSECCVVNNCF